MGIGRLHTEADLERFILGITDRQLLNAVQGLPAKLAELELMGGGGGGAVVSVNGKAGVVVLEAGDVGADPVGSAASAASAVKTALEEELLGAGLGVKVAGADPEASRPKGFRSIVWIASVPPENALENDLLVKTE